MAHGTAGIILGNLIATGVVIINSLPGSYYYGLSFLIQP